MVERACSYGLQCVLPTPLAWSHRTCSASWLLAACLLDTAIVSFCRPCHRCMPCVKVDLRLVHRTHPSHSSLEPVRRSGSVYNVVDDDPAGRAEVVAFARRLLNPEPPRCDDIKAGGPPGATRCSPDVGSPQPRESLSALGAPGARVERAPPDRMEAGAREPAPRSDLPQALLGAMPVLRKSGNAEMCMMV